MRYIYVYVTVAIIHLQYLSIQGKQTMLKKEEAGNADKMHIGGVDSLYRIESYDGTWVHGER